MTTNYSGLSLCDMEIVGCRQNPQVTPCEPCPSNAINGTCTHCLTGYTSPNCTDCSFTTPFPSNDKSSSFESTTDEMITTKQSSSFKTNESLPTVAKDVTTKNTLRTTTTIFSNSEKYDTFSNSEETTEFPSNIATTEKENSKLPETGTTTGIIQQFSIKPETTTETLQLVSADPFKTDSSHIIAMSAAVSITALTLLGITLAVVIVAKKRRMGNYLSREQETINLQKTYPDTARKA